jgi:hypothetical protein
MPCASAPKAPWVEVWLSPQTIVVPGQGEALLGADDVDDALADIEFVEIFDAEILGVPGERLDLDAAFFFGDALERSVVGMLWSTTASVLCGAWTLRPVMRRPSKACGLVTSWTRWRSI